MCAKGPAAVICSKLAAACAKRPFHHMPNERIPKPINVAVHSMFPPAPHWFAAPLPRCVVVAPRSPRVRAGQTQSSCLVRGDSECFDPHFEGRLPKELNSPSPMGLKPLTPKAGKCYFSSLMIPDGISDKTSLTRPTSSSGGAQKHVK